jgi:nickel-dependent lactate racemase
LAAECRSGIGRFAPWLKEAATPDEVIRRFAREGFTGREHSSKAFMWARALRSHKIFLYCEDFAAEEVKEMFFHPTDHLQDAIEMAIHEKGPSAEILVLPSAASCIPVLSP